MKKLRILVIIPAYNEQESIQNTVENLKQACNTMEHQVDYVVINDGSKDNTLNILKQNHFSFIDLPVNLGIGGGMQTGYLYAYQNNYDIAIQLDGDGQHDPHYIQKLIQPLVNGQADMAIGSRYIEKTGFQSTGMRQLGIKIISTSLKILCRSKVLDVTSGFRACNKKLIHFFVDHYAQDYPEPEAIISVIRNGYKIEEVPVVMNERQGGTSSISGFKSIYYMCKVELALLIQAIRKKGE